MWRRRRPIFGCEFGLSPSRKRQSVFWGSAVSFPSLGDSGVVLGWRRRRPRGGLGQRRPKPQEIGMSEGRAGGRPVAQSAAWSARLSDIPTDRRGQPDGWRRMGGQTVGRSVGDISTCGRPSTPPRQSWGPRLGAQGLGIVERCLSLPQDLGDARVLRLEGDRQLGGTQGLGRPLLGCVCGGNSLQEYDGHTSANCILPREAAIC